MTIRSNRCPCLNHGWMRPRLAGLRSLLTALDFDLGNFRPQTRKSVEASLQIRFFPDSQGVQQHQEPENLWWRPFFILRVFIRSIYLSTFLAKLVTKVDKM